MITKDKVIKRSEDSRQHPINFDFFVVRSVSHCRLFAYHSIGRLSVKKSTPMLCCFSSQLMALDRWKVYCVHYINEATCNIIPFINLKKVW